MPNKTRNANRKKHFININKGKKSKTKPKKEKCVMREKNTCKKTSLIPASCFYQKIWISRIVCHSVKNVGGTPKKDLL